MERCTKAVIYKDNLEYNLKQIRKYVKKDVKLCVAVKADSYGHNAVLTAQLAQEIGAAFVAVAWQLKQTVMVIMPYLLPSSPRK